MAKFEDIIKELERRIIKQSMNKVLDPNCDDTTRSLERGRIAAYNEAIRLLYLLDGAPEPPDGYAPGVYRLREELRARELAYRSLSPT